MVSRIKAILESINTGDITTVEEAILRINEVVSLHTNVESVLDNQTKNAIYTESRETLLPSKIVRSEQEIFSHTESVSRG